MTERVQEFLLKHTKFLQYLINEKLGKRKGMVGKIFRQFEIGPRQMGKHTLPNIIRYGNYCAVWFFQMICGQRVYMWKSLNFRYGNSNMFIFVFGLTIIAAVMCQFQMQNLKEFKQQSFQDQPIYWQARFNMIFPPNILNDRMSAHFIEINHIYFSEMCKKYHLRKAEVLEEREKCSDHEKKTRYITNKNYIYEPMGEDTILNQQIIHEDTIPPNLTP